MPTILYVEDTPGCREPIAMALRAFGYDVLTAADGDEAKAILARAQVDLLLLDVVLPQMHGLQFLSGLRQDPARERLPVIIFTAATNPEWRQQAAAIGVQDYLLKGHVSLAQLHEAIRRQLAPATAMAEGRKRCG